MAKCGITNIGGGGGIGSDELTVTKEYVLSGLEYVGSDTDDEKGVGVMINNGTTVNQNLNAGGSFLVKGGYHAQPFTVIANSLASQTSGTAIPSQILNGQTAWVNGNKLTGSMTVQSILSFSCAPYSAKQIIFTWKNPSVGPFSGVIIVGKTGGYPTSVTDGTRYYKGFGNNANSSGTSNATISGFSTSITYYFRAFSYSTLNGSEWVNTGGLTANTIIKLVTKIFPSSTTFTVPSGINQIEVFCVGGGGGGGDGSYSTRAGGTGSGGGGGYTKTQTISVTPGQQIPVVIGAGAAGRLGSSTSAQRNGGDTSFGSVTAKGGYGGYADTLTHSVLPDPPPATPMPWYTYSDGGSGGGGGGGFEPDTRDHLYAYPWGANGGSNGVNGGRSALYNIIKTGEAEDGDWIYGYGNQVREWKMEGGRGQGTTTRAFGEGNGTIYSGGGGGAGGGNWGFTNNGTLQRYNGAGGSGGMYGGGVGGTSNQYENSAQNGISNSGGGGGGGGGRQSSGATRYSGAGGSGVCIIRYIG